MNPGQWQPFFGDHLVPGQEYIDCAKSELGEELGINIDTNKLIFHSIFKYTAGTEYQANLDTKTLQLEQDEVDEVLWKSINDIRPNVIDPHNQTWSHISYEADLLLFIENNY